VSDLYPTPTRIQLLRDLETECVVENEDGTWLLSQTNAFPPVKVSAEIRKFHSAGWVELLPNVERWVLTDAGREILRGAS
jgi:hypothetical protein